MTQILQALALAFISLMAARTIGVRLVDRWIGSLHSGLRFSIAAAVGLFVISYAVFFSVVLGWAGRYFFWTLFGLLGLTILLEHSENIASLRRFASWIISRSRRRRWALAAASGYGLLVLGAMVLPVTSVDELVYHLEIPRRLSNSNGSCLFRDNIYAYFPQLGEMLFLFGFSIGGVPGARIFHALFGVLLAFAIYGFCRESLPRRDSAFALAAFFSAPSVLILASLAYVDLMFTLYGFLALVLLLLFLEERRLSLAVAAGTLAGAAWCTKYTGMQFLMLLVLAGLVARLLRKRKDLPWQLGILAAVSVLVVAPYLLRNWLRTGWPLFPFDVGFFELGPGLNWDSERARLFLTWLSGFGTSSEGFFPGRVLAPLRVFLTARFRVPEAYDGILGPLFLMAPLAFAGRRTWRASALGLFCVAFAYYWAFTTQQVRFLLPVLPVLAYFVACGTSGRERQGLRRLAMVLVLLNLVLGIREVLRLEPWGYWTGRQSEQEYQAGRVIGFGIYREANRQVQEGELVYLVNMRNLGYLLDAPWTADFIFEYFRLGKELEHSENPSDLLSSFQEKRVTHLLIDERITLSDLALDRRAQDVLRGFLADHCELLARDARQPGQSLWRIRY